MKMKSKNIKIVCIALLTAILVLGSGSTCSNFPGTVRIDGIGTKGFDKPQKLSDSQSQKIVELILDTREAKEDPPIKTIYNISFDWIAIVWNKDSYSYLYTFGLEAQDDPQYKAVPESAVWYPGAVITFGEYVDINSKSWLIDGFVDFEANKVVYIESMNGGSIVQPPPGQIPPKSVPQLPPQ
jgi:hypothetical protein